MMIDTVTTSMRFAIPAHVLWRNMMFYEDVPARPSWLLRTFLPRPIRTVGDKTRVGALIRCEYTRGQLVKQMTIIEPPQRIGFAVVDQRLGVERTVTALHGSYEILPDAQGCEVRLATTYRSHRRPRWFWRPVERFFIHALHRHILQGLAAVLARNDFASAGDARKDCAPERRSATPRD
jgi:hypothetical protein